MENKFEFFKEPRKANVSDFVHSEGTTRSVIGWFYYAGKFKYIAFDTEADSFYVWKYAVFIDNVIEPVQTIVEKAEMTFEEAFKIVAKVFADNTNK